MKRITIDIIIVPCYHHIIFSGISETTITSTNRNPNITSSDQYFLFAFFIQVMHSD